MMACPSLIRNSTPLIKGPGSPGSHGWHAPPSPSRTAAGEGEARRHPRHTPVDRATKQKRVTLAPTPAAPIVLPVSPTDKTNPVTPPPPPKPQHTHSYCSQTHTRGPLHPFPLSLTINFTNQLISLSLSHTSTRGCRPRHTHPPSPISCYVRLKSIIVCKEGACAHCAAINIHTHT